MISSQIISVGNLLLDLTNYRHGKQSNQKAAFEAIMSDQKKKLVVLASDILSNGLNPSDLPIVIEANDGNKNYIVVEGNRRLTAIQLLLNPELSVNTSIYKAFKKLAAESSDKIPKFISCVVAPNRSFARIWIDRKHANGLEGAGTEHWSPMAKARADIDAGIPRPEIDVINFVLANNSLDPTLREALEGSDFNLTTLQRLVTTNELQESAGIHLKDGKITASNAKAWTQEVLTDLIKTIAEGSRNGEKFTERHIDTQEKRKLFVEQLVAEHKGKKKAASPWGVSGKPVIKAPIKEIKKTNPKKSTITTEDQVNLIPKGFKLTLPSGKINDIFVELKRLDLKSYRHSASVLFRVFIELSLDEYISRSKISLPVKKDGKLDDRLITKLNTVTKNLESAGKMTSKELQPLRVVISDKDSFLSTSTLNAYVHSLWMHPDPMSLKIAWLNIQLFIERLWDE